MSYRLKEQLSSSKRSQVFRAIDSNQTRWIVKKMAQAQANAEDIEHYQEEYEISRLFNSEYVQGIDQFIFEEGSYLLVSPDVAGISLDRFLQNHSLDIIEKIGIARKMATAIGVVHSKKIIHKDVNLSNFIYIPRTKQIKIIDFSIASRLTAESQGMVSPDIIEGTLSHISPEQTGRMNRDIDYRSDFYSLGVSYYELFTGILPFNTSSPRELIHCHIAQNPSEVIEICKDTPQAISEIVKKLMQKETRLRYQSIDGLVEDLEMVERDLAAGKDRTFELGTMDRLDSFQLEQKPYGREAEIEKIRCSFEEVARGEKKLTLVNGLSGIGKTAVVKEICQPMAKSGALFVTGKFDQFKNEVPFSAIKEAFVGLIKKMLTENQGQLEQWKSQLNSVLKLNVGVLVEIFPEIRSIVDGEYQVPNLSSIAAQNRFHQVMSDFLSVMAGPSHPLVLFLDDLQWADSASLELIKSWMNNTEIANFYLIGAYRTNEVFPAHPFQLMINSLKELGQEIETIRIGPIDEGDIAQLISDSLQVTLEKSATLAELVYEKTKGNPFFVRQFLISMHEQGLIVYSHDSGWLWDLREIKKQELTSNVADLLVEKMRKLNRLELKVLSLSAFIGRNIELKTLQLVTQIDVDSLKVVVGQLILNGYFAPLQFSRKLFQSSREALSFRFKFQHDRIQHAAYSLVSDEDGETYHAEIGRKILSQDNVYDESDRLFEVTGHLNRGRNLLSVIEKEQLLQFNIASGKRASKSAAFSLALEYFEAAAQLLPADCWEEREYSRTLEVHNALAENALFSQDIEKFEQCEAVILDRVNNIYDKSHIVGLRTIFFNSINEMERATNLTLDYLDELGQSMPRNPGKFHILWGILKTKFKLRGKTDEYILNLPEATNRSVLAAHRQLRLASPSIYYVNTNLVPCLITKVVCDTIDYGISREASFGFATYGFLISGAMAEIDEGVKRGALATKLVDHYQDKDLYCYVHHLTNYMLNHTKYSLASLIPEMFKVWEMSLITGQFEWGAYQAVGALHYKFFIGEHLENIDLEMERFSTAIENFKQDVALDLLQPFHQTVANLIAPDGASHNLEGVLFSLKESLPRMMEAKERTAVFNCHYCAAYLGLIFNRPEESLVHLKGMQENHDAVLGMYTQPMYFVLDALILASCLRANPEHPQKSEYIKRIKTALKKVKVWAGHGSNYINKQLVLEAELQSLYGNHEHSDRAYKQSIAASEQYGFLSDQCLYVERFARALVLRGDARAEEQIRRAHSLYVKWGAKHKVQLLEKEFSQYFRSQQLEEDKSSSASNHSLDVEAMVKASQEMTAEIEEERLVAAIMKVLGKSAGAQFGYVFMPQEDELAVAATYPDGESSFGYSEAIVNYVSRSRKDVVLGRGVEDERFFADVYLRESDARSIICLPILRSNEVKALVYLENRLTEDAFTEERVELLRALAAQASISLDNARLYGNLMDLNEKLESKVEERTAQLKQAQKDLVDSAHRAGMAEIAANVLHNVGNQLNGLKLSQELITKMTTSDAIFSDFMSANQLLEQNIENLGTFINEDPRGRMLMQFYLELGVAFKAQKNSLIEETEKVGELISQIQNFVSSQSEYVSASHYSERLRLSDIVSDYLITQQDELAEKGIVLEKKIEATPIVDLQKTKLLAVLSSLLENAKAENEQQTSGERKILIQVFTIENRVELHFSCTGSSIEDEMLTQVFQPGSPTVESTTVLGLHGCANYVSEMKGEIRAEKSKELSGTKIILSFSVPKTDTSDGRRAS